MKKIQFIIFFALLLSGCNPNSKDVDRKELISQYIESINTGGYQVHIFIERDPVPREVDKLMLPIDEKFKGISIHRSILDDHHTIFNYKEAFKESNYPFYIVVGNEGLVLKTNSVKEIINFFK